jgi:hypothetical protein
MPTMCRPKVEVSTSGYYAWRKRSVSQRSQEDTILTDRVGQIRLRSRGIYGAPRVQAELYDEGVHMGRKRVPRLMQAAGLQGMSRRWHPRTTRREVGACPAPAGAGPSAGPGGARLRRGRAE